MKPAGNVLKCPNCKLINPAAAERCDCGYDFLSNTIKEPYFKERLDPSLQKFGGWLLLFWYGMTVATPLVSLIEILVHSSNTFAWVFWLMFSSFCIYTGISLRRLKPSALKLVKVFLLVSFVSGCLAVIFYAAGPPTSETAPAGAVLGPIIWWFYFKKSKRVRTVFGRNF